MLCLFSATRMPKIKQGCAVANYIYYGIKDDYMWCLKGERLLTEWFYPQLFRDSDRVYRQGPKGGVKLVRSNWDIPRAPMLGYIGDNQRLLKEFMWIKLKAKHLN